MPAHSKIVDENEVLQWYREGVPYREFVERYQDLYGIRTTETMWSQWRRRRRLPRRSARGDELIPWAVKREHRFATPLGLLRLEARRRGGLELTEEQETRLDNWLAQLEESNAVVYYDPETPEGFFYIPREEQDTDLIRVPPPELQRNGRGSAEL